MIYVFKILNLPLAGIGAAGVVAGDYILQEGGGDLGSPRTDMQNKETASRTIAESPAASMKIWG